MWYPTGDIQLILICSGDILHELNYALVADICCEAIFALTNNLHLLITCAKFVDKNKLKILVNCESLNLQTTLFGQFSLRLEVKIC